MNSILRLSFLALVLNISLCLFAQTELTIHVETPGTLEKLILQEVDDDRVVQKLTVTGSLDGDDICQIRYMCGRNYYDEPTTGLLTFLDMGGGIYSREKLFTCRFFTTNKRTWELYVSENQS